MEKVWQLIFFISFRYCVEFEVLKASKACYKLPSYNLMIEGDRITVRCDVEAFIYENTSSRNYNDNNKNDPNYKIEKTQSKSQLGAMNEDSSNNNQWTKNTNDEHDNDDNANDNVNDEDDDSAAENDSSDSDNEDVDENERIDHDERNNNNNNYIDDDNNYYYDMKRIKYYDNKKLSGTYSGLRMINISKSPTIVTTTIAAAVETTTTPAITMAAFNSTQSPPEQPATTVLHYHCRGEGLSGRTTRWSALAAPSCHGKWLRLTVGVPKSCKKDQFIFV